MRGKVLILPLAAGGFVPVLHAAQPAEVRKPNIVFILADDMGYECVGAYGGTYRTPRIDILAQEGILFEHAYSQPLSTPSRVQLMTGRYNHKNYSEFGFLNQDQHTFAELAHEAGYRTAIVGKWQLGANSALPAHFGFDNYCLWQLSYKRTKEAERYAKPLIEADGRLLERTADDYGPDIFVEYIERFIDKNREQPFLLYYPMVLVHDPFVSTPDSRDWETNPEGRVVSDTTYFRDMVAYCDRIVGRIVDKLKAAGLYDSTLIIFAGDNGTNVKIFTPMRDGHVVQGGKGTTTDAGTRVPLIVAGGGLEGGRVCDDLVDFTDFLPTMAEAMKVSIPQEWDTDGVSFLPRLEGRKGQKRKWVFCHYDPLTGGKPHRTARRFIRNRTFKLYSTGEFYDLSRDVLERYDIPRGKGSAEAERARRKLQRLLDQFPAWERGDAPAVKKVSLPGLEPRPLVWHEEDL